MKTYLGSNIKFLRRMKGLTQTELASLVGINRSKIASYEAGLVEPQFAILLLLVKHLDTELTSLLTKRMEQNVLEVFDQPSEDNNSKVFHNISKELEDFIESTNNAQKTIDGFRELFAHSRQTNSNKDFQITNLYADLDNLVALVGKLLETNWNFIRSIQETEQTSDLNY